MSQVLKNLGESTRFFFAGIYLLSVLMTVPIAFQLGGLQCGLAFTLTLFSSYFITTTLNAIARKLRWQRFIAWTNFLYYFQNFNIIGILHIFLSLFSHTELSISMSDENPSMETITSILKNNDTYPSKTISFIYKYFFYYAMPRWKFCLSYSTPLFALVEGFFTILAIQVIGETNIWLTTVKNSSIWIILSLIMSSSMVTTSIYYIYKIYVTPLWHLSNQVASLLSFTFSLVGGVAIYGIVSHRGSVVESSLFFAYIVCCIYEISPIMATTAMDDIFDTLKESWQIHQRNFFISDNLLIYYYNSLIKNVDEFIKLKIIKLTTKDNFSNKFNSLLFQCVKISKKSFKFILKLSKRFTLGIPSSIYELYSITLKMASESISPVILVNLCYRVLIFYAATRIIPALESRSNGFSNNNIKTKSNSKFMKVLYWYSPCILIAMYTNLILQYSGELKSEFKLWNNSNNNEVVVDSWRFWNWCNIFWTITLYGSELIGGRK
ncbi:hypothetical protein TBLA_0B05980 [Henningerozyma blattae CBS 6284]|uniref:Uncharacterized protein n=1 Tax=Henningerozyma blattae (strain ATCC 34711 / CBS 6284 / DSM 70876 / NBRC 10599 / NRRL Y-10934 / UCD 77-7) TaxID=1071380 RepID=I2GZ72_HENB6|nr:hypothetical protein TBLA_0B05980 [Tetrapisispora blattae CBS 6284]CCH59424.1 hypothetical protein TBLA_0B05980 [Tetrapisispora blattae CBS 6284]